MMLSRTTVDHHSQGIAAFTEGDRATLVSAGERGRESAAVALPFLQLLTEEFSLANVWRERSR